MSTSRIPPPSSRTPLKSPGTPSKSRTLRATPTTPTSRRPLSRATTPTKASTTNSSRLDHGGDPEPLKPAGLSIKEAIALKRAEARKAQEAAARRASPFDDMAGLEDALPPHQLPVEEEPDLLGRLPVRETIEKSRSTGSLNLATRELVCLPSALYEIHLNVTPQPLKSVPNEPRLPATEPARGKAATTAWFEAQDLTVLKAWNNEIVEIQEEISMFGSLKTLDLHKNKIASLPSTIADLSFLTVLDLSENQLREVPDNLWALPELTTLNLAHNNLNALPMRAPFASTHSRTGPNSYASNAFFTPAIVRAASTLPKLVHLDVSHNNIRAAKIDAAGFPDSLVRLDLSHNPLGNSSALIATLASAAAYPRLKELRFEKAVMGDESLQEQLPGTPFRSLKILDFSETQVTLGAVQVAFSGMAQELSHDFTVDDPPEGVVRITVGKRVIKESWEIELEQRKKKTHHPAPKSFGFGEDWDESPSPAPAAATATPPRAAPAVSTKAREIPKPRQVVAPKKKEVVKEAWEIEAEQGLLTEGGRRLARAQAARAAAEGTKQSASPEPTAAPTMNNPKYYTQGTGTLKLPASAAPPKINHGRAFSMASSGFGTGRGGTSEDLAIPAPTLPLSIILAQPFADTLKVLILTNRRLDRSFMVPSIPDEGSPGFLPRLEELDLEGCNFEDSVAVQLVGVSGDSSCAAEDAGAGAIPARTTEPLIPTIARLFPSLRTLNLSYNRLSDASFTAESLNMLILSSSSPSSPNRPGLRHLRLRGNRLVDLAGFQALAGMFKGNRDVPEWKLEGLDVRDNEVGRLPPELGLLPLDVFLVEGNVFRVPQHRIWEREGTKGLLSWLRGRIE